MRFKLRLSRSSSEDLPEEQLLMLAAMLPPKTFGINTRQWLFLCVFLVLFLFLFF